MADPLKVRGRTPQAGSLRSVGSIFDTSALLGDKFASSFLFLTKAATGTNSSHRHEEALPVRGLQEGVSQGPPGPHHGSRGGGAPGRGVHTTLRGEGRWGKVWGVGGGWVV